MRNPRNQFILLGFLCQGLSWDNSLHLILSTLLWITCLRFESPKPRLSSTAEGLLLGLGCVASYGIATLIGKSAHFALGDGLMLIQAVRLMRPLHSREKIMSILIGCFHVGVVCTLAPDVRFVVLIAAAVYLLPKSLMAYQIEQFSENANANPPRAPLGFKPYAAMALGVLGLFLALPRFSLGSPLLRGAAAGAEDGLLGSIMDPSRSAGANSDRVVFQIDGRNLGYLRCHVLTEFDGVVWMPNETVSLHKINYVADAELVHYQRREARVKDISMLGRILPTDGRVVGLYGDFFNRTLENAYGILECGAMWNSAENTYTYWIDPTPRPEPVHPALLAQCLAFPPTSKAVSAWLDNKVPATETNQMTVAKTLERYLARNFTYRLGAPELNRLTPVDDFIFVQKQGHCERFASTLALLLRMRQIPSRVVIGYLPTRKHGGTGWYQIRFKDAHAWTEAYIEGHGWITLDATPSVARTGAEPFFQDLWDSMEFAWYSRVVNFDGYSQKQLLISSVQSLQNLSAWFAKRAPAALGLGVFLVALAAWKLRFRPRISDIPGLRRLRPARREVKTYYDRLLQILERRGFHRDLQQTPLEFLERFKSWSLFADIELITRRFCENYYGNRALSANEAREIEEALARVKKAAGPPPNILPHEPDHKPERS